MGILGHNPEDWAGEALQALQKSLGLFQFWEQPFL
jgi:hypothetical protein